MKHGILRPLIRIKPDEVSIMSNEEVKVVYDRGLEKSPQYVVFSIYGSVRLFEPPGSLSSSSSEKRRSISSINYSPLMASWLMQVVRILLHR